MTDLYPNYGTPFVTKTRRVTPVSVAMRIRNKNPRARPQKLYDLFAAEAADDPELTSACIEAQAVLAFRAVLNLEEQSGPAARAAKEKRNEQVKIVREVVKERAVRAARQVLSLSYLMPNGKELREVSGTYVVKHCKHLAALGKKAGKRLMGDVFDDNLRPL